MGTGRIVFGISAGLVGVVVLLIYLMERNEKIDLQPEVSPDIEIIQSWELPKELSEVSGIAHLGENQIAGIQDELGNIFIYNLDSSKVVRNIQFAGQGDYEGIAVVGADAYVLQSDGIIYRVRDFLGKPEVEEFDIELGSSVNLEGLAFDRKSGRFFVAVKEDDPISKDYKGIYAVDRQSMKSSREPVIKMTFQDSIFDEIRQEDLQEIFYPSEIGIAPSGEVYLLEAEQPRLLVFNSAGKPEKLHLLDETKFPQPEGLTFSDQGELLISSEGKPAMLHLVRIKD